MNTYKIALYPGDGIGPEVVDAAMAAVEAVQRVDGGFRLDCTRFDWSVAYYETHGRVAPEDYLDVLRPFDAIFLGALGWPERLEDSIGLKPILEMRQAFDLYANIRPAQTFPGVSIPLSSQEPIDLVVVRENSEGEYTDIGGTMAAGTPRETAIQSAAHTRHGVERIMRFGFEMARTRRRRLAMISKSNAMRHSYGLWDRLLPEIAAEFDDVSVERLYVDAATLHLVRRPHTFDVIVASNLFGDILSDLTGAVTGSLGLSPSANLNPERNYPSFFEPVHGSAPDIAGRGIANPSAAIFSAAMMLDWLGEKPAAAQLNRAVEQTLAAGHLTPDLGGKLTTAEFTSEVVRQVGSDT